MASFRILLKPSAEKELRKLGRTVVPRIARSIENLAKDLSLGK